MRSDSDRIGTGPDEMATYILLIFVAISLGLDHLGDDSILVFLTTALAVVLPSRALWLAAVALLCLGSSRFGSYGLPARKPACPGANRDGP